MLCEVDVFGIEDSFLLTWLAVVVLTLLATGIMSAKVFHYYYWPSQVTYEKWKLKSNPEYPSPSKVRMEIITMLKGLFSAALCPALRYVG